MMELTKQEIQKIQDHHCYLDPKDSYSEKELREAVGITDGDVSVDWRHVACYVFNNFTRFRQDFLREIRIKAINEQINNNHSEEESTEIIDKEIQSHIQRFLLSQDRLNMREVSMIMERYNNGDFFEFKFKDDLLKTCLVNIS